MITLDQSLNPTEQILLNSFKANRLFVPSYEMIIDTQTNLNSSSEVEFISKNGEDWISQNTPGFKVKTLYGLTSRTKIVTHQTNLVNLIPNFKNQTERYGNSKITKYGGNNYKLTYIDKSNFSLLTNIQHN